MISEFKIIDWVKKEAPTFSGVKVSIGDDAAVLKPSFNKIRLMSTDMLVDGVDFNVGELSPENIGRKALAINLSDMAAMGAEPKEFVISIGLTPKQNFAWLKKFYKGLFKLARNHHVSCVGGDMSVAPSFLTSITVLGETKGYPPVLRKGAKPGDWIAVTGSLGGSILKKHYAFKPRITEGIFLARNKYATSMMDISDGLVQDLEHLLKASDVGACLDLSRIPIDRAALKKSGQQKGLALQYALSDGEDFELLFTVSDKNKEKLEKVWKRQAFNSDLFFLGTITAKNMKIDWTEKGIILKNFKLNRKGYQHFS